MKKWIFLAVLILVAVLITYFMVKGGGSSTPSVPGGLF
jgi:hypothetical protein